MKAKSIKGKSAEEIQSMLQQAKSDGFRPTLAIVFVSVKQDRKAVCRILSKEGIDVFGATSCGEFIDGFQTEGGAAILLLDILRDAYSIVFEEIGNRTIQETAHRLAHVALLQYTFPCMLLCSTGVNTKGEYFEGQTLINTLKQYFGNDQLFFGGMAGDDMSFTGSYVFTQEKETDYGVAAIVFDKEKIAMTGMAITGWKPMGIARTVTKSSGNKLFSIDNISAVDMYFKYLGKEEKSGDKDFKVFEELGFTYPFITEREPGGDMVLKTPLHVDHNEKALVLDMEMPEGTKMWFSMPPDFDIVDEVLEEATQLKNSNMSDADALLIFSCAGRQPVLGPLVTAENDGLANLWQTPMAGFFTYGEFGRTKKGKQEFHSGACCWVALKEI